eukprot:1252642-Amphidinium_carterae.1
MLLRGGIESPPVSDLVFRREARLGTYRAEDCRATRYLCSELQRNKEEVTKKVPGITTGKLVHEKPQRTLSGRALLHNRVSHILARTFVSPCEVEPDDKGSFSVCVCGTEKKLDIGFIPPPRHEKKQPIPLPERASLEQRFGKNQF